MTLQEIKALRAEAERLWAEHIALMHSAQATHANVDAAKTAAYRARGHADRAWLDAEEGVMGLWREAEILLGAAVTRTPGEINQERWRHDAEKLISCLTGDLGSKGT